MSNLNIPIGLHCQLCGRGLRREYAGKALRETVQLLSMPSPTRRVRLLLELVWFRIICCCSLQIRYQNSVETLHLDTLPADALSHSKPCRRRPRRLWDGGARRTSAILLYTPHVRDVTLLSRSERCGGGGGGGMKGERVHTPPQPLHRLVTARPGRVLLRRNRTCDLRYTATHAKTVTARR